jgi:hypothetical protein
MADGKAHEWSVSEMMHPSALLLALLPHTDVLVSLTCLRKVNRQDTASPTPRLAFIFVVGWLLIDMAIFICKFTIDVVA